MVARRSALLRLLNRSNLPLVCICCWRATKHRIMLSLLSTQLAGLDLLQDGLSAVDFYDAVPCGVSCSKSQFHAPVHDLLF